MCTSRERIPTGWMPASLLALALLAVSACASHAGGGAPPSVAAGAAPSAIPGLDAPPAGFVAPSRPVAVACLVRRGPGHAVPQGDDVLAEVAVDLPERAELPAPAPLAARLGLWLCARGSAGNPGDLLGRCVVRYADGGEEAITLREGERLAGQLKDPFPSAAERVGSGLVGGQTVSTYVTWWDNPHPERGIAGLRLEAVHPRYVIHLLGTRGGGAATAAALAPDGETATLGAPLPGAIDAQLFGVACPHFLRAKRSPDGDDAGYDRDLADLRPGLISIFAPEPPADGGAFTPAGLPVEVQRAGERLRAIGIPRVMMRQVQFSKEMTDEAAIARVAEWYADCIAWLRDRQGWPIVQVEIFNERILSHPQPERERSYRFFNLVAERLHARAAGIQVGGTAECYPDEGLVGEFLDHCAANADFVTWHLYPTGSADTPLAELMGRADRIARIAQRMDSAIAAHAGGRHLPQLVSEYHINYSAWKPVDRRVLRGAAASWSAAVLIHALDTGHPRGALIWHFRDAAYGLYGAGVGARPAGVLFRLLNRIAPGSTRVALAGGRPGMLTAALAGPAGLVVLLVNTRPEPCRQCLAGLPARPGVLLTVGPDDQAFATAPAEAVDGGLACTVPGLGMAVVHLPPASR